MTSLKPYLIRSLYDWIVDNQCTPHLLVDATNPNAILPLQFAEDGKIVLNIRPQAVHGLDPENDDDGNGNTPEPEAKPPARPTLRVVK